MTSSPGSETIPDDVSRNKRQRDFLVVVPYFNESSGIRTTLGALASQSDTDFGLILVDNGSTDDTSRHVAAFARQHPDLDIETVDEPEKGTGAAADTGFRRGIDRGAQIVARTDADCIPDQDWVRNIKRAFSREPVDLLAGRSEARRDDVRVTGLERFVLLPLLYISVCRFGTLYRFGGGISFAYRLVIGNNMAIRASMYLLCGGFPRTSVATTHEDRVLERRARAAGASVKHKRDVVVYSSVRRIKRYGYLNSIRWYWNHGFHPEVVDVR
jgi:glycosyltransferase involved in cell wall biosynthesis